MKRLVYVAHRYPVVTETFTAAEVAGLAARGIDLEVRALRPSDRSHDELPGPRAHELPRRLSFGTLAREFPRIAVRPRRRGIAAVRGGALASALDPRRDHVHAQFPLEAASAALFAARASGASFSFAGHTYHDLDLMTEKLAAAQFVVVGSEFERSLLAERYGDRWASKIHVRRLGVPERPTHAKVVPGRVVSVGTLTGKKGHDVLLRAAAVLVRDDIELELQIVGEGPDRQRLESLAASLDLRGHVEFVGSLGHEATLDRIRAAAVFALCCRTTASGDHDCLPVALMDAMSLGVPCVSSAAFGVPELIQNEVSGLLAPPDDPEAVAEALKRILDDSRLGEDLGRAGRETVRRDYDLDRNLDRLGELFRGELEEPLR